MRTEEDIINNLTLSVTDRVSKIIKESLSEIVQLEISKALTRALTEGEFYRGLNNEVIGGIGSIYSEIKAIKKSLTADSPKDYLNLLGESDHILDSIILSTERATLRILENLEKMQDQIRQIRSLMNGKDAGPTETGLDDLDKTILDTMTELSFQDLTGQQIRRVIQSLKRVDEIVFDVYVTSEIMNKSKEHSPDKDIQELREEAGTLIHNAKSRQNVVDQQGVDKLLEQLGL